MKGRNSILNNQNEGGSEEELDYEGGFVDKAKDVLGLNKQFNPFDYV